MKDNLSVQSKSNIKCCYCTTAIHDGIIVKVKTHNIAINYSTMTARKLLPALWSELESTHRVQTSAVPYNDQYTGRLWVGCYICHSKEGPVRLWPPPRPLLAVPVAASHPSTASVPTSYYYIILYSYYIIIVALRLPGPVKWLTKQCAFTVKAFAIKYSIQTTNSIM